MFLPFTRTFSTAQAAFSASIASTPLTIPLDKAISSQMLMVQICPAYSMCLPMAQYTSTSQETHRGQRNLASNPQSVRKDAAITKHSSIALGLVKVISSIYKSTTTGPYSSSSLASPSRSLKWKFHPNDASKVLLRDEAASCPRHSQGWVFGSGPMFMKDKGLNAEGSWTCEMRKSQ